MKQRFIREWNISYEIHDGEGGLIPGMVIFPSFRKAVWWFIRKGRKCCRMNSNEKQAVYRLGQMDMKEAAAQMLLDLADGTQGDVCTTLIDAAQRVRGLAVCETAEGGANGEV